MTDSGDLEVELVGEPPTTTVELRPGRGRRREWLLLVAAIAVVVGVGLVGDGGRREPAASSTTTTSAVPTTVHRRFTASVRRFPPTTTTTLAAGPVAPFPTGTAIVYMNQSGGVKVLDLDTGDECAVEDTEHRGLWLGQVPSTTTGRALLQTRRSSALVDASCAIEDISGAQGSYPVAIGDDRFWTADQNGAGGPLVEHDLRSGTETGRTVDAPPYITGAVTAGDRLIVGLAGQMTEVTRHGKLRDLGPGLPVALRGTSLASVRCEQLQCRLHLTDLDSGATRQLTPEPLAVVPWSAGAFSPDGSLLRVEALQPGEPQPRTALIDVTTGEVRVLQYSQAVFTVGGTHLIARQGSTLVLLSLDGTESWPIDGVTQSGIVAIPGRRGY